MNLQPSFNGAQAVSADAVPGDDRGGKVPQKEEEEFSRRHSPPTRVLAWMLIAGFVLQLVEGMIRSDLDLGGILFLIIGLGVRRGSQNALRFAILACAFLAAFESSLIASDLIRMRPLMRHDEWHYVHQISFWVYGISPPLYLLAECLLGIVALKARRLTLWSPPTRAFAGVLSALLLGFVGFRLWGWYCDHIVAREMAAEVGAARAYVSCRPSASALSLSFTSTADAAFSSFPQIEEIRWYWESRTCNVVYRRNSSGSPLAAQREGKRYQYTEWMNDSSGNRGQLEIDLVVPEHE